MHDGTQVNSSCDTHECAPHCSHIMPCKKSVAQVVVGVGPCWVETDGVLKMQPSSRYVHLRYRTYVKESHLTALTCFSHRTPHTHTSHHTPHRIHTPHTTHRLCRYVKESHLYACVQGGWLIPNAPSKCTIGMQHRNAAWCNASWSICQRHMYRCAVTCLDVR